MGNAVKSGRQRSTKVIFVILIFLVSGAWGGCSQQITSATFVQKTNNPIEFFPESTFPEQPTLSNLHTTHLDRYLPLIKKYAQLYNIDWLLVLSVIKQESKFDHEAISYKGAYGLMQIMPLTQIELAEKLGVREASSPRNNLKAGIYHLKSLYSVFNDIPQEDRIYFTLAAYNAGLSRIIDAQKIAAYLGNDPHKWSSVQAALPFLSKRDYTLHSHIWNDGYPPSGYFKDWHQTIEYVDNVTKWYDSYSLALK